LNSFKIFIIILFFSISFSQESAFFSKNKKGAIILSVSTLNNFNSEELNSKGYNAIKLDYKSKSPFEVWIEALHDEDQDVYIGTFGIGYLLKTGRKTMISLYAEKNFYNRDYNEVDIVGSYKNFYFKYGWVFYVDNQIPFYIKYTNEYKETIIENEFDKFDKILFGSYAKLNKLIIGYSFNLDSKDFLNLDFKDGEVCFTLGYKIL